MFKSLALILAAGFVLLTSSMANASQRFVVINGVQLADNIVAALERGYQTRVLDGYYWYDRYSGLWGQEGGPAAGFIQAGLPLGGRMSEQASRGDTGVLVNGRRLQRSELYTLMQLVGQVSAGRYWLDAAGNAGYEGGPALVNLFAAGRSQGGGNSGGGYGGWNRNTPGGNWGGDGNCSYYMHPDGPSVMTGDC